jgi:hypothetical protein
MTAGATHGVPDVAERYRAFARDEAAGRSPLYEELALGVAGDPDLLALLRDLPPVNAQPNLLLAAVRWVAGTPTGFAGFRAAVLERRDEVVATMLARRTQTNEPARTAAFYPLLAALPQPLALLEVGASAGLCLYPDRYRFEFNGVTAGDPDSELTIECEVNGRGTRQPGPVTVVWRGGIDLDPLDVCDDEDVRWLETLVWPELEERRARLRAAVTIARREPVRIVRGDLLEDLPALAASAPPDATLVVFHTAVLYQVPRATRAAFADLAQATGHWLSQEAAQTIERVGARLTEPQPPFSYVVARHGEPVAFAGGHGGWIHWL